MPGSRIYVVNDLSLVSNVQKQYKKIAFEPIASQAAQAVMSVGPVGNAIIGSDKMFEDDSYLQTFVPYIAPALYPGPGLDGITKAVARVVDSTLTEMGVNGPIQTELYLWVRRQIFVAETESIYGEGNPFRDARLETAW
jgi:hypothetical protein